ncbi:MAG: hypothetical protein RLZZ468_1756 [Cyanobacteriota bacterium]|jgi:hypothetical protein
MFGLEWRSRTDYAMSATTPLIVPDTRRPGALLPPLSLRLPAALVADLDGQAARLGCSRAALSRALLSRGVAQLQETMPA